MRSNLLIYGVTGYIGGLVSRLAAAAGLPHVAAGRDLARVAAHADRLMLPARAFSLSDPAKVSRGLAGAAVVLNAAGPFTETALPLAEGCLQAGAHYLDLTDTAEGIESLRLLDGRGRDAGVMLMPGGGFPVVPIDALAARLRRRLPGAVRLRAVVESVGGPSRGSRIALLGGLGREGSRRRQGELLPARVGDEILRLDLGAGPRRGLTDPWRGDLVTSYWSAVFQDIDTYTVYSPGLRRLIRLLRLDGAHGARALPAAAGALRRLARLAPLGPDETALAAGTTRIWTQAEDPAGDRATARLRGPHAYLFAARVALWLAQRILAGRVRVGFQTPATAYGPDLIDRLVEDIEGLSLT